MTLFDIISVATPVVTSIAYATAKLFELIGDQSTTHYNSTFAWRGVLYPICIHAATLFGQIGFLIRDKIGDHVAAGEDAPFIALLLDGLLWISLALSFATSRHPSWNVYGVSACVSAVSRVATLGISFAMGTSIHVTATVLEFVRLALLGSIAGICAFAPQRSRTAATGENEPLLRSSMQDEDDRDSKISDDSGFGSHSDDDSDSEEEDLFTEKRQQAVKEKGGFWGYIREFRVFLPYIWPGKNFRLQAYLCLALVSTLAQRAVNVLYARQLGILVDHLFRLYNTGGLIPWQDVTLWLFYELLYAHACGLPALNEFLESRITNWSSLSLRVAAFDHVMGLDMSWRDSSDTGEIVKAVDQAGSLASLLHVMVFETAPILLDVVVALWYVNHLLDIYASIIVLYIGVGFMFVTYFISLVMKNARRTSAADSRTQNRVVYEVLSNWSTVSFFNRRKYEQRRLTSTVTTSVASSQWDNDISLCLFAAQQIVEILGLLAISILAAYRVVQGQMPPSNFVSLEQFWDVITTPLWIFGHSFRQVSSDLIDAERLLELFQQTSAIKDGPKTMPSHISGAIDFSKVTFGYNADKPAIKDLSFSAKPGQTIAIVGETGSGKSTTLKLLMRFYDVLSGSIKVSGTDVRDVSISSLREIFGFVPQNAVLFNETIMDNVRYGRLDATDEEVYAACRAASIHDRILSFPKGYRTKTGERGVKLSGGELQRISIARVILKDPQIVLLDEATSALDTETEYRIQAALKKLTDGRTTIVIAHRLSTVINADQILVMDKGSIVERGTHAELLGLSGKYRDYWSKQSTVTQEDRPASNAA